MNKLCCACRHWEAFAEGPSEAKQAAGECRVRAPAILMWELSKLASVWPETRGFDWCGEWAAGEDDDDRQT